MNAEFVLKELLSVADQEKAILLQKFFKTGKGQYAEGDLMLGINVPVVRNIVKSVGALNLDEIQILLDSQFHEAKLAGFLFLVKQFKKTLHDNQKILYEFYLNNAHNANNWDLVDLSCKDIVGVYLLDKQDRSILYQLAQSDNLWKQRVAIVATWTFIKFGQFNDTLAIAELLMNHKHDLIHKAVGWMLREVGKKNKNVLAQFLEKYHTTMPRTTLRYAIEHFLPEERNYFMRKS
jgi:3-methyladenine DNA glycosylase AlkD